MIGVNVSSCVMGLTTLPEPHFTPSPTRLEESQASKAIVVVFCRDASHPWLSNYTFCIVRGMRGSIK